MRKYIYPILCTLLIVSQGCDHFLGNKPKGYAIPEAFEDYVKLLASQSLNSCMSTDAQSLLIQRRTDLHAGVR